MRSLSRGPAIFFVAGAAIGCSANDAAGPPTYYRDVAPVLARSCAGCHVAGGIAPFSLTTYADARSVASLVAQTTAARKMPPWGAFDTDECRAPFGWKNDPRLSDADIATLGAWAAAGTPEGDPADDHAVVPKRPGLERVDKVVAPIAPFVASGSDDEFRCFVMDPGLTEKRWLRGMNVVVGNAKVVHHAVLVADLQRVDQAFLNVPDGYECFNLAVLGGTPLGTWVPGMGAIERESNIGTPISAGSLLVLQVHYHPAGAAAEPDLTHVELEYTDAAPDYELSYLRVGNAETTAEGLLPGPDDHGAPEFLIPAGAKSHVETMEVPIKLFSGSEARVYGARPHMHLVGAAEKIDLATPSGQACLIDVPRWDFTWQRSYAFDAPIDALPIVHDGDRLRVRCTYDNSIDNAALASLLLERHLPGPVDVKLGLTSMDEMCIAEIPLVQKVAAP